MTKPVRQKWRRTLLLIAFVAVSHLPHTNASAEERFQVANFQLTGMCKKFVPEYDLTSFEIEDDSMSLPMIVSRDPSTVQIIVQPVFFKPFLRGLLFTRATDAKSESVLHCAHFKTHVDFVLLERSEKWMIFESGARQATEAHIHSYISCGSNCGYSRYESITFFDDPEVPKDEEGMLHSSPVRPLYWLGGDTHPNEYLSRWFRSYLTDEERIIFDRIIDEG